MEIDHTITECDQSRRDQLLQEELLQQNRALRETPFRNMRDMEELQESPVLRSRKLSRRKLTEDQNTIMELRTKIQESQNEVNCMSDSKSFLRMPSQYAVDHTTFPVNGRYFHFYRDPGGKLNRPVEC